MRNVIQMTLKKLFFAKITKKSPSSWLPDLRLWWVWLKQVCSPRLPIYTIQTLPLQQNPGYMPSQARLLILHSTVSLSHTKYPFSEIFDDVIACDLWFSPPSQSKILATPPTCSSSMFFLNFNHSWFRYPWVDWKTIISNRILIAL